MHMGRKGALILLVLVAFWAAKPALACLVTAAPLPCCQGMMRACKDSVPMANMACCHGQDPDNAIPPATAAAASTNLAAHLLGWPVDPLASPQPGYAMLQAIGEAPSPPPPGFSSILRI